MQLFRGATALELIAVRVDAGEEIEAALSQAVADLQLAAGAVVAAHGTLERFILETPAALSWPPAVYTVEKQGPGRIIAGQGIVAGGKVELSLTVARRNELFAGRALAGTTALFGAEFVLLRAGNTRWSYVDHPQSGVPVFEALTGGAPPKMTLMGRPVDPVAAALVPPALIRKHQALPVAKSGDTLVVAMADPSNPFAREEFRAATGLRIQPAGVDPRELAGVIEQVLAGR